MNSRARSGIDNQMQAQRYIALILTILIQCDVSTMLITWPLLNLCSGVQVIAT